MAFILKRPDGVSRGIIVFTHKEQHFFREEKVRVSAAISALAEHYDFAMHWGHFSGETLPLPDILFHLAGPGTLRFREPRGEIILPFCSRNFIPADFQPGSESKFWDILTVTRPLRLKNLDQFFTVLKSVMQTRPQTRTLMICPEVPGKNPGAYNEIASDLHRMFTPAEQENITLMLLSPETYPFPLSQPVMAHFYRQCRFFTLFSDQEGESRVISEALLCGLPVFVKNHLRGGGRDYLTQDNSAQFSSLEEASRMFLEALDVRRTFELDTQGLAQGMRADLTVPAFVSEMERLFAARGEPLTGAMDLTGLDRKLPGHCKVLPVSVVAGGGDDLITVENFQRFAEWLLDRKFALGKPDARWYFVKTRDHVRATALGRSLRRVKRLVWK